MNAFALRRPYLAFAAAIALAAPLPFARALAARASLPAVAVAGRPAPAFVLDAASGAPFTLERLRGKPLVLNVFASWCPPCREELPRIAAAARANAGRVTFVGVDEQEPAEMAQRFVRAMRLPYPIAYDHGQFSASYAIPSLPGTVFIDAAGTVRAIYRGAIPPAELARDLARITTPGST